MHYRITRSGAEPEVWHVELPDRFDFAAARHFLRQIKDFPGTELPAQLRLDCRRTRYIDTAGLGSLLLLGEHFGANRTILIEQASGDVRQLLDIAGIERRLAGRAAAEPPLYQACTDCANASAARCPRTLAAAAACPIAGDAPPAGALLRQ